jgi:hypothetical protein
MSKSGRRLIALANKKKAMVIIKPSNIEKTRNMPANMATRTSIFPKILSAFNNLSFNLIPLLLNTS